MAKPKRRTESEAIALLENRGATVEGKLIKLNGCLGGLSGGACLDYLVNHKGYKVARTESKKTILQRIKKFFGR